MPNDPSPLKGPEGAGLPPDAEEKVRALERLLTESRRAARTWQTRFWLLSLLWLAVLFGAALVFANTMFEFDRTRKSISEQEARANSLTTELEESKKALNNTSVRMAAMERRLMKQNKEVEVTLKRLLALESSLRDFTPRLNALEKAHGQSDKNMKALADALKLVQEDLKGLKKAPKQ
jgi:septal ring factor EnvC (AmiA/AmiB activator)